mgnify:CR=1 FL=1
MGALTDAIRRYFASSEPSHDFAVSDDIDFTPLPPREALAYFKAKTLGARFSYSWLDMWQQEHAAAFVVAKAMRKEVLTVLYEGLEQALSEGITQAEFIKRVRPLLQKQGWWGFKETTDPLTGEIKRSELGTPRRLRTIYRTNLTTARAVGRWEQIERTKDSAPWLMYVDAGDGRVRHAHRQLNRVIRRVDDPFWKTFYPPNGWNCRCIVRQLSDRQLEKMGLKPTTDTELALMSATKLKSFKNSRTGQIVRAPAAVNPAFAYNVGQARLRPLTPGLPGHPVSALPRGPSLVPGTSVLPFPQPRIASADMLLDETVDDMAAIGIFLEEFETPLWRDPAQGVLMISDDLFRHSRTGQFKISKRGRKAYLPLVAATIKDPQEIWYHVGRSASGEVELSRISFVMWDVDGEAVPVFAVFNETKNLWEPVTGFQVDDSRSGRQRYAATHIRMGTLVYQKPGLKYRQNKEGLEDGPEGGLSQE